LTSKGPVGTVAVSASSDRIAEARSVMLLTTACPATERSLGGDAETQEQQQK
jgi:hypothetical protein